MSIKARAHRGDLEDNNNSEGRRTPIEYVTAQPLGPSRIGLDMVNVGLYYVAQSQTVEAGSTKRKIVLTGHSAYRGDLIRITSSSNSIQEYEIAVDSVDANNIYLVGDVSASFAVSDTIDILRPVTFRMTSDGGITTGPLSFNKNGSIVEVTEDTGTPANNIPLPVKLVSVTGDVSITANDLNVQLTHAGANPDSVQIGDGTEVALVNASGELQVADDTARTTLSTIAGLDFATQTTLAALNAKFSALGQNTMANSVPVVIASDQSAVNVNNISGTVSLPTGASTEAKQDSMITLLTTIEADVAQEATLSALNGKFGSLGQKASAGSAPVVLSSEQEAILTAIQTAVEIIDNAISGTEMQVDLVNIGGAATEVTVSSIDGKLPSALGQQNSAGSLSVVIASDQSALNTNLSIVDFLDAGVLDASTTNIPTTGTADLVTLAANVKKIFIIDDIGEYMSLRNTGGTVLAYLPLGGGEVEVSIASGTALKLYSETGSTISLGNIAMNFLG